MLRSPEKAVKSGPNSCERVEFPRLRAIRCCCNRLSRKRSSRSQNTHELLTLRPPKKDLYSTSTLFPFLEKTKIKLKDDLRQGRTIRDKYRQVSTRTLKKVPYLPTNTDTERQGTTAKRFAPNLSKDERTALISELMNNPNGGLNKERP